jgi:hypothetical protein
MGYHHIPTPPSANFFSVALRSQCDALTLGDKPQPRTSVSLMIPNQKALMSEQSGNRNLPKASISQL